MTESFKMEWTLGRSIWNGLLGLSKFYSNGLWVVQIDGDRWGLVELQCRSRLIETKEAKIKEREIAFEQYVQDQKTDLEKHHGFKPNV